MSIETELSRIQGAKTDIATAIEGKGVTVPAETKIDGMADLIAQIEQGGGDASFLYDYVDDATVFAELTYLNDSNTVKLDRYGYSTVNDTKMALADAAKATNFVLTNADEWSSEKIIDIYYSKSHGGFGYYAQGEWHSFTGYDDPQILETTGVVILACPSSNEKGIRIMLQSALNWESENTYQIKNIQDFRNMLQWRNEESWGMDEDELEFSDGTKINRKKLVAIRFGKALEAPEVAEEFTTVETFLSGQFMPKLKRIGTLPKCIKNMGGHIYGYSGLTYMPLLNCPLILPSLECVTYDNGSKTGYGHFMSEMYGFNSNIYILSAWDSQGGQIDCDKQFRNMRNMTSTVYWAKNPIRLDPLAFSVYSSSVPTYPAYTKGVRFAGPGAAAAKAMLPDLDGVNHRYRKIILA